MVFIYLATWLRCSDLFSTSKILAGLIEADAEDDLIGTYSEVATFTIGLLDTDESNQGRQDS